MSLQSVKALLMALALISQLTSESASALFFLWGALLVDCIDHKN